jgi:HEAT repeat protein
MAFVLAVIFVPSAAVIAADPPTEARTLLDRYYAVRLKQPFIRLPDDPKDEPPAPPWDTPFAKLKAGTPDERTAAVALLRDLAATALADETSGTAPWRNTPYWGGGADIPARTVREAIADELGKVKPTPEVLPLLAWYLDREPMDKTLSPVLDALGKLDGEAARELRTKATAHLNAQVAVAALGQMAARKQPLAADTLAVLCHSHRERVREAARKLNATLDRKDPGAFDPVKAIRAEPIRSQVAEVLKLLPDLPGKGAEFVTVSIRYLDEKKKERDKDEETGWVIERTEDAVAVYTPYGRVVRHTNQAKSRREIRERIPAAEGGGVLRYDLDVTAEVTVKAADLGEVVKEVAVARKGGNADFALSERGGLTGQFQGRGAGVVEVTLAAWLYRAGKDADAAALLLPAFDSFPRDAHLVEMLRHRLGALAGQRMLVAFAGDRDYKAALTHAGRINDLYPDTQFHRYAKGLAVQLPRRMDDFGKHKLPTAAEWAKLKPTLTREGQIDYLATRLRLINSFQMGQPGGYNTNDTQYAEPSGMAEDASWGLRRGKTEVINPLSELDGCEGHVLGDGYVTKGLELTIKDIPALSKHLRDDCYMPCVGFWRNFHPDRTLASTRTEVAGIINGLAVRNLCGIGKWDKLTVKEIDAEIARINTWAAENADKSRIDLKWIAFQDKVKAAGEWRDVEGWVDHLLGLKELSADRRKEVFELAEKYFRDPKATGWTRTAVLDLFAKYDQAGGLKLAQKHLADPDPGLRLSAALLVFRAGDKAKARPILGDAVQEGDGWEAAAEALLADDTPESRMELVRLTRNPRLHLGSDLNRPDLLARCAAAGLKGPYAYYLKLLQIDGNEYPPRGQDEKGWKGTSYPRPVAEVFAAEIVRQFAPNDPEVKKIAAAHPKAADQIPHLKKWLDGKLAVKE